MSNITIFAIFDKKACVYQNFFFAKSVAEAIRSYQMAINDPKTQLNQFPAEFALYKICEIDEETAIVKSNLIESLGDAINYLIQKE